MSTGDASTPEDPRDGERRSVWTRLYHGETEIDFVGRFGRWLAVSGAVIAIGLVSLGIRGLNLGIDFEGGVVWEMPAGRASVADLREALDGEGLDNLTVQSLRSEGSTPCGPRLPPCPPTRPRRWPTPSPRSPEGAWTTST